MDHWSTTSINERLYRATTQGDVDLLNSVLEELSEGDELLHMEAYKNNSVLHVAASFGHRKIVQLLVQKCPSLVTKRNSKGDTPLHSSARDGHLPVITFLIDYANNVSSDVEEGNIEDVGEGLLKKKNLDGNTALHEAIKYKHESVACTLIKADQELLNLVNNNGESAFYLAAEAGLYELVAELLRLPIDHLLCEMKIGRTALHAAISRQHTGIIRLLVEEKSELLRLRDAYGRGPLHYAFDFIGSDLVVSDLLRGDPSIAYHQDCDGTFPIHKAASHGFTSGIVKILQHCPNSMWLLDHKGRNALHVAVASIENRTVYFFLKRTGVEKLINEKDVEGNTPMHLAVLEENVPVVRKLLRDKRVDLGAVNKEGLTPRDIAKHMYYNTETSLRKTLAFKALLLAQAPRSYGRTLRKDFSKKLKIRFTKEKVKGKLETLLIVATLIITVTFAAGFTLPGGYKDDGPEEGMATMIRKATFHIFVITDSLAMCTATFAALTIVWAYIRGSQLTTNLILALSFLLIGISLGMIILAFGSGLYLVLSKLKWLATVVLVVNVMSIVLMLPFFLFYLFSVFWFRLLWLAHRQ